MVRGLVGRFPLGSHDMPNFRRNWAPGGTFFFTVVTAGRAPLFRDASARRLLGKCFRVERASRPFAVDAIVLLPDHLEESARTPFARKRGVCHR